VVALAVDTGTVAAGTDVVALVVVAIAVVDFVDMSLVVVAKYHTPFKVTQENLKSLCLLNRTQNNFILV
jgi:hypothetical protein